MPKQSKVASTRLKDPKPLDERTEFYCCRCGKKYKRQKGNFSVSQSPLYKGNNGFLPLCYTCVDEIYQHYRDALGNERDAIRRVCSKLDIYWDEAIFNMVKTSQSTNSRMRTYISRSNIIQFIGNTYDVTLDKEAGHMSDTPSNKVSRADVPKDEYVPVLSLEDIPEETIRFWGSGYTPEVYLDLNRRYEDLTSGRNGEVAYANDDPVQNGILKKLCILDRRIETGGMTGAKISDDINSYNQLLGSGNLKPSQKRSDSQVSDSNPFGVWIQKWENEKPIPEPDPEFADVDGIIRYISIWFLGHLCKMLKIKNSYSRMYEAEIERLRVERPEYNGEDDEEFFQDIFESGGG